MLIKIGTQMNKASKTTPYMLQRWASAGAAEDYYHQLRETNATTTAPGSKQRSSTQQNASDPSSRIDSGGSLSTPTKKWALAPVKAGIVTPKREYYPEASHSSELSVGCLRITICWFPLYISFAKVMQAGEGIFHNFLTYLFLTGFVHWSPAWVIPAGVL